MNTVHLLLLSASLLTFYAPRIAAQAAVLPTVETAPVPSLGDAADDIAIWVDPTDPARSTVIGTDKLSGLAVYDLAGNQLQFLPDGDLNNVDLRTEFPLGGSRVALVTACERNQDVIDVYAVDPSTRLLRNVAARKITSQIDVYGSCMYRSPTTGETYIFVTSKVGQIEQWRLFDDGTGKVDGALVRAFALATQTEGCVADDEGRSLFLAEEDVGIWRYGAEPNAGTVRVQVDRTGTGGHLSADVEGLTIYYASGGTGYLIASSQGNSTYVVYDRRPPHAFRLAFKIADNTARGVDGTSNTDGIDVMNLALGSRFPSGVFIAQDATNPGGNQNFKLVPWQSIASAANPPLIVDTLFEPSATACRAGVATSRDGSGVNPIVLTNVTPPRIGSVLIWELDCSGHAAGTASLSAFTRPSSGTIGPFGEGLVDTTSFRIFQKSASHTGNVVSFHAVVPPDPGLCGVQVHLQGTITGSPATKLTNALDLTLGF